MMVATTLCVAGTAPTITDGGYQRPQEQQRGGYHYIGEVGPFNQRPWRDGGIINKGGSNGGNKVWPGRWHPS